MIAEVDQERTNIDAIFMLSRFSNTSKIVEKNGLGFISVVDTVTKEVRVFILNNKEQTIAISFDELGLDESVDYLYGSRIVQKGEKIEFDLKKGQGLFFSFKVKEKVEEVAAAEEAVESEQVKQPAAEVGKSKAKVIYEKLHSKDENIQITI